MADIWNWLYQGRSAESLGMAGVLQMPRAKAAIGGSLEAGGPTLTLRANVRGNCEGAATCFGSNPCPATLHSMQARGASAALPYHLGRWHAAGESGRQRLTRRPESEHWFGGQWSGGMTRQGGAGCLPVEAD
jgi:hypothetical protein